MCQRAPLVSVVANSLSYMGKAESPSLRRKMESLQSVFQDGASLPESRGSISNNYNLFQCIEAQAWDLMLSKLKAAKITPARVKAPRDTDKDAETFSLSPTSSRFIDQFLSSRSEEKEDGHYFLDVDETDSTAAQDASGNIGSLSYQDLYAIYLGGLVQTQVSYANICSPIYESHSLSAFLPPSFYVASASTTADTMELTY